MATLNNIGVARQAAALERSQLFTLNSQLKRKVGTMKTNSLIIPLKNGIHSAFRILHSAFALALVVVMGTGMAGYARTINVPNDYQTIQAAINASQDGDMIVLQENTYYENLDFNGRDVIVASLFAIDGDKAHISRTIIDGSDRAPVGLFNEEEGWGAGFTGVTLQRGRSDYGGAVKCATPGGGRLSRATLRYCRLINNYAGHGGAISCHAGIRLYYCEIIGNTGGVGGAFEGSGDIILDHCLFYNNYKANQPHDGGAFLIHYGLTLADNCTFYGNSGSSQMISGSNSVLRMSNSIIWGGGGIEIAGNANDGGWLRYSCLQNGENAIVDDDNHFTYGEGNIAANPGFVNADGGDFHLNENSPCIDAGYPDSPPDPDRTRSDMGAYFFRQPMTIYVPDDYETIQAGIDAAEDGDTVLVAAGEYVENINFTGKNIALIGNPENPEEVVINGNGNGSVVEVIGGEVIIKGFAIRGGQNSVGSGMLCRAEADVRLQDLIIEENECVNSPYYGAGLYVIEGCTLIAEECSIRLNSGSDLGGGLFCVTSSLLFLNCNFANNSARYGAGAYIVGSDCHFTGSSLNNNQASQYGGASIVTLSENRESSEVFFQNVSIIGNTAAQDFGGVLIEGGGNTVNFSRTTIENNGNTGLGVSGNSDANIVNTIIWHHQTSFYGQGRVTVAYSDIQFSGDTLEGSGNIDLAPLFLDPDNGDFRLQVTSPCIDAGDPESELDPDGTRADMGAFYVHQTFHRIALRQGWNMLSSFNQPRSAAMPAVWDEVVSRGNLILAKNQSGQFYYPGVFNGMAPWDVRQGYMAKLAEEDTLVVVNVPVVTGETPIPLRQGWNLAAYFPEEELDVRDAFASIQDDLIMVKDINGRFYRAQIGFSNMFPLRRGQGYQVAVSEACELTYPAGEQRIASVTPLRVTDELGNCDAGETSVTPLRVTVNGKATADDRASAEETSHFHPTELTGGNMSLLVGLPQLIAANSCGEIGVFTEKGLCVGAVTLASSRHVSPPSRRQFEETGEPPVEHAAKMAALQGIAIWADDPTTPEIDGAVEGEALGFRLWDGTEEVNAECRMRNAECDGGDGGTGYGRLAVADRKTADYGESAVELSHSVHKTFADENVLRFQTDDFAEVTLDVGAYCNTPLPTGFVLHNAFPNPFNASTLIRFDLPEAASVELTVSDLAGREVAHIAKGNYAAGSHSAVWNALNQPSGIYLMRLETPLGVRTNKITLVR